MFLITFAMFSGNLVFTLFYAALPLARNINSLAVTAGLITLLAALVFKEHKETFPVGTNELDQTTPTPPDALSVSEHPNSVGLIKIIPPSSAPKTPLMLFIEDHDLTLRETDILLLLLKRKNNPSIREELNISPNTLKYHLRHIYQKFEVRNRQELFNLFDLF